MARLKSIKPEIISEVAQQIGNFYAPEIDSGLFGAKSSMETEWSLAEYFPILNLSEKNLIQAVESNLDIRDVSQVTKRWHYQMAMNESLVGFAQVLSDEYGNHQVASVSESEEAMVLQDIIELADIENSDFEGEAALLDVVQYGVRALVLLADHDDSESVVYPFRTPPNSDMQQAKKYSSQEFLNTLMKMPILEGVRFQEPNSEFER